MGQSQRRARTAVQTGRLGLVNNAAMCLTSPLPEGFRRIWPLSCEQAFSQRFFSQWRARAVRMFS